jgi:hypothetical protein
MGSALGRWWPAALPALAWLAVVLAPPMNHDVAGLLAFTARWLDGEALYRDLLEVNPPLIFLLNAPAVVLGRWLPGGPVLALQLLVVAACGGAAWGAARHWPGGALARASAAGALPVLVLLPGYAFAQREHIMLVLALPYLVQAARRTAGEPAPGALAAALAAALGFALKPHFLLVPAVVEALVLACRGRAALRDPVPWAMLAVWLGYATLVVLAFPDYLRVMLPWAAGGYLGLNQVGWWDILASQRLLPPLLALALLAWPAWRPGRALPRLLVLAGLAAAAAAAAQGKGFPYHALPAQMLAVLAALALAQAWLERALPRAAELRRQAPAVSAWALGLLGVAGLLGPEAPWTELHYRASQTRQLALLFAREAPDQEVLLLSPAVAPVYPALNYAGTRNIFPAMTFWPLQASYRRCPAASPPFRDPAAMDPREAWLFGRVAELFARSPPRLLMLSDDRRMPGCDGFDAVAYFARHPLFAATLARYARVEDVAGYRVWRREE